MTDPFVERIERHAGAPGLADTLCALPGADLGSLLLHVTGRRAAAATPSRLLDRYLADRFVRPSTVDPIALRETELAAFDLLPAGFAIVEPSPLAPLGTVTLGGLSPALAVATVRGTEAASDVTNLLALEAALRRRAGEGVVRVAACQRVVRPQVFDDPSARAHFCLFGLVTAGLSEPDWAFERAALAEHLGFHRALVQRVAGVEPQVTVTPLPPAPRSMLEEAAAAAGAQLDDERTRGRGYYRTAALSLDAPAGNLADGGFDWGARLLSNERERMLISGVGLERVSAASPAR